MMDKNYMRKPYKDFSGFVKISATRELEYFIMDATYSSEFNYKIKNLMSEIKEQGKESIEFSVIFNTEGEIALIHEDIVGSFIADSYTIEIENYYKNIALNKIIRAVINSNDKVKRDFVAVSYGAIYNCLGMMYKEIKCKRDIIEKYKALYFSMHDYEKDDIGLMVASILVLEDICKYIGISSVFLLEYVEKIVLKKKL